MAITSIVRRALRYLSFGVAAFFMVVLSLYVGVLVWARLWPLPPEVPTGVIPQVPEGFKGLSGPNELGIPLESQIRAHIGHAYVSDFKGLYKNDAEGLRLLRIEVANNNPFAGFSLVSYYKHCGGNGIPMYKAFDSWWWSLPKRWLPVPAEDVAEAFKTADWLVANWPQFYTAEDAQLLRFTYCLWVNRP